VRSIFGLISGCLTLSSLVFERVGLGEVCGPDPVEGVGHTHSMLSVGTRSVPVDRILNKIAQCKEALDALR
jgi:hypothetical protein